jgi:hypothetical protein
MINLILNTINFLKSLTLFQIVLYQVGMICLFQIVAWCVEYFVGKI